MRRWVWLALLGSVALGGLGWMMWPRDPPPAPRLWPSSVWQRVTVDVDQMPFDDALEQLSRDFNVEFDVDPNAPMRTLPVTWRVEQGSLYAAIAGLAAQAQLEPVLQPSGVIRLVPLREEPTLQFHSLVGLTGFREPLDERELRIATPLLDRFEGERRFELAKDGPFLRAVPGGVLSNLPQRDNEQLRYLVTALQDIQQRPEVFEPREITAPNLAASRADIFRRLAEPLKWGGKERSLEEAWQEFQTVTGIPVAFQFPPLPKRLVVFPYDNPTAGAVLQILAERADRAVVIPHDVIQVVPVAWRDEVRVYPLADLRGESLTSISKLTADLRAAPISLRCAALGDALAVRGSLFDHLWVEDFFRQMRASRSPLVAAGTPPDGKPFRNESLRAVRVFDTRQLPGVDSDAKTNQFQQLFTRLTEPQHGARELPPVYPLGDFGLFSANSRELSERLEELFSSWRRLPESLDGMVWVESQLEQTQELVRALETEINLTVEPQPIEDVLAKLGQPLGQRIAWAKVAYTQPQWPVTWTRCPLLDVRIGGEGEFRFAMTVNAEGLSFHEIWGEDPPLFTRIYDLGRSLPRGGGDETDWVLSSSGVEGHFLVRPSPGVLVARLTLRGHRHLERTFAAFRRHAAIGNVTRPTWLTTPETTDDDQLSPAFDRPVSVEFADAALDEIATRLSTAADCKLHAAGMEGRGIKATSIDEAIAKSRGMPAPEPLPERVTFTANNLPLYRVLAILEERFGVRCVWTPSGVAVTRCEPFGDGHWLRAYPAGELITACENWIKTPLAKHASLLLEGDSALEKLLPPAEGLDGRWTAPYATRSGSDHLLGALRAATGISEIKLVGRSLVVDGTLAEQARLEAVIDALRQGVNPRADYQPPTSSDPPWRFRLTSLNGRVFDVRRVRENFPEYDESQLAGLIRLCDPTGGIWAWRPFPGCVLVGQNLANPRGRDEAYPRQLLSFLEAGAPGVPRLSELAKAPADSDAHQRLAKFLRETKDSVPRAYAFALLLRMEHPPAGLGDLLANAMEELDAWVYAPRTWVYSPPIGQARLYSEIVRRLGPEARPCAETVGIWLTTATESGRYVPVEVTQHLLETLFSTGSAAVPVVTKIVRSATDQQLTMTSLLSPNRDFEKHLPTILEAAAEWPACITWVYGIDEAKIRAELDTWRKRDHPEWTRKADAIERRLPVQGG